jgi:hypothetical protein
MERGGPPHQRWAKIGGEVDGPEQLASCILDVLLGARSIESAARERRSEPRDRRLLQGGCDLLDVADRWRVERDQVVSYCRIRREKTSSPPSASNIGTIKLAWPPNIELGMRAHARRSSRTEGRDGEVRARRGVRDEQPAWPTEARAHLDRSQGTQRLYALNRAQIVLLVADRDLATGRPVRWCRPPGAARTSAPRSLQPCPGTGPALRACTAR